MSCLRNIFKKKKKDASWMKPVMQKLQDTHNLLVKERVQLEKDIGECMVIAQKNAKSQSQVASRALQKKKRLERRMIQIDKLLTNVEEQKDALEYEKRNVLLAVSIENIHALKNAKKLRPDKIRKLIDDITNQYNMVNEISNDIRNSFVPDIDEDELDKELEKFEMEELKANPEMLDKQENQKLKRHSTVEDI